MKTVHLHDIKILNPVWIHCCIYIVHKSLRLNTFLHSSSCSCSSYSCTHCWRNCRVLEVEWQ